MSGSEFSAASNYLARSLVGATAQVKIIAGEHRGASGQVVGGYGSNPSHPGSQAEVCVRVRGVDGRDRNWSVPVNAVRPFPETSGKQPRPLSSELVAG